MKLSERLEAEMDCWPQTSTLQAALREAAELARSVEVAPVACVGKSAVMCDGWKIYGTDGDNIASLPFDAGQRVRIVPEAGQEVGNG